MTINDPMTTNDSVAIDAKQMTINDGLALDAQQMTSFNSELYSS